MRKLILAQEIKNSHPFINICFNKLFKEYTFLSFSDFGTQILMFSRDKMNVKIEFSSKTLLAKIKFHMSGNFGILQNKYTFDVIINDDMVKCLSINREKNGYVCSKINNNLYKEMMKWKKKDCLIKDLYWGFDRITETQLKYCSDIIIKVKKSIDLYKSRLYKFGF